LSKQNIEIDISNTQTYDHSLSCLGTGTSIKSCGIKSYNCHLFIILWG